MKHILKRLSRQPREVKSQVAFIVALGVTAVFGFVWVTTIPARFSSVADGVKVSGVEENMAALADAVQSQIPTPPPAEPETTTKADDIRAHIDSLVEKIQKGEEGVVGGATTSNPKAGTPIRIEVMRSTGTTSTATSSVQKPIRIETR